MKKQGFWETLLCPKEKISNPEALGLLLVLQIFSLLYKGYNHSWGWVGFFFLVVFRNLWVLLHLEE